MRSVSPRGSGWVCTSQVTHRSPTRYRVVLLTSLLYKWNRRCGLDNGGQKLVSYNSAGNWFSFPGSSSGRRYSELKARGQSRDDVAFATAVDCWVGSRHLGSTKEIIKVGLPGTQGTSTISSRPKVKLGRLRPFRYFAAVCDKAVMRIGSAMVASQFT